MAHNLRAHERNGLDRRGDAVLQSLEAGHLRQ